MAVKYDNKTLEAIWTLMCMDVGPVETMRRLAADEAGIGYEVQMPMSTVKYHRRQLRAQRGEPVQEIKPEDRQDAARAIECRAIALLRREQLRLEQKQKTGELTRNDVAKSVSIAKATQELARTRGKKAQDGADAARRKSTTSWLDSLATEGEEEQDQQPRDDHAEQRDHGTLDHAEGTPASTETGEEHSDTGEEQHGDDTAEPGPYSRGADPDLAGPVPAHA